MHLSDIPTPAVAAIAAVAGGIEPEFLSLADCYERYRLKRGYMNDLISRGKVRSISLRERGKLRGRRLVVHDSLRAYIYSHEVKPGES